MKDIPLEFEKFGQFIIDHPLVFLVLIVWSLWWKGRALWRAAQRRDTAWFVVILLVNVLGLLEIFYLYGPGRLGEKSEK